MKLGRIENGIVLDHITPGRSMEIYKYLKLDTLSCAVAIIKNVESHKDGMALKDIIKINDTIDVNLDALGYIDPGATVNTIRGGKVVKKEHLTLPKVITGGVIRCKNPRCITSVQPELEQTFFLEDGENKIYRCMYCETAKK